MNKTYAADLKAQVIAEWKAGASLDKLALAHDVPKPTLQGWVRGHTRVILAKQDPLDSYDLDGMARGLVGGSFTTLANIHGVTEDKTWLKAQRANELAILYGVVSDKLIRLLAAVRRQDDPDSERLDNPPLDLHTTPAVGTRLD